MAQLILVVAAFLITVVIATSDMAMILKGVCLIALAVSIWAIRGREEEEAHTFAKIEALFSGVMGLFFSFFGVLSALILL